MPEPEGVPERMPDLPIDLSRLRRMDRFGRSGFLAGSLALAEAGLSPKSLGEPSIGVVFGTSHGCRDSLIEFTRAMRGAASVDDLSPAVFAQTVHNSVNGELGVAWGLGGVSETFVSGRTGGSEAIARARELLAAGRQRSIVAGGAEGINPAMTGWWDREMAALRPPSAPGLLREGAAALVLVTSAPRGSRAPMAELVSSAAFFEPRPKAAGERAATWLEAAFGGVIPDLLLAASPDLDGAFTKLPVRWLSDECGDLGGASGAVGAVLAVRDIAAGRVASAAVLTRDHAGPVSLLAFSTPRRG